MADSSKTEPVKTEEATAAAGEPVAEPVAPTEEAPVTEAAPAERAPAPAPKEDGAPATSAPAPATEPIASPETSEKPVDASEKSAGAAGAAKEPTKEPVLEPTADKPAAAEPTAEKPSAAPSAQTPFSDFAKKLPDILKEVGHDEMWGVKLADATHVPTAIVLQKFLNANDGDLATAIEQFTGALKFRKEKKPLDLLTKTFSAAKFGQLGAVTTYEVKGSAIPEVFTWNFYGNVKDKMDEVFVPLEE